MDDRFLFRGRCPHTGKWYAGFLMTSRDGYHSPYKMCIMHDKGSGERDPWRIIPVDPATIGQSTGLFAAKSYRGDKPEDLLVFEGDIVRFEHPSPDVDNGTGVVVWSKDELGWEFRDITPNSYKWFNGYAGDLYEIIGTIHDQKGGGE